MARTLISVLLCASLIIPTTVANRVASGCCSQTLHKCAMSKHARPEMPSVAASHQALCITFRVEALPSPPTFLCHTAIALHPLRCDQDVGLRI